MTWLVYSALYGAIKRLALLAAQYFISHLFIGHAIGTHAVLRSVYCLRAGGGTVQLLAGNAGTDVERQKRRIFTAGNHLRHGVMTKGFRALVKAGIKRAAMEWQRKNAGKDLFYLQAGWLKLSVAY